MTALFEDENFPANLQSIYYDGRADPGIEWKRPKEISDNPVFIDDGASKHDIAQGHLSDCWFLSAAAVLATKSDLFSEIIPAGQGFGENYNGRFLFRFWRYGSWEEVDVDDRLPTRNGKLYFCHNRDNPNEFWSALMEKAYAKVHRSYQALDFGYSQDALVDLTGGIGEFIDLTGSIGVREAETEEMKAANITKLFKRVKRLLKKNASFVCSAINAKDDLSFEATLDNGLVTGHAYSICKVNEILVNDSVHEVIKLRNPWGQREWSGAWSDSSSEWDNVTDELKQELGLAVENEGEFWMPFGDWINNFDILNLCHLTPDSVHGPYGESLWQTVAYHGIWAPGATAGGSAMHPATYWDNPQYFVHLRDPDDDEDDKCTLVVSLMQKYARVKKTEMKSDDTEEAIGFDLYKFRGDAPEELDGFQASSSALQMKYPMFDFEFFRERSRRYSLSPGIYCIIPSTYTPDKEAQYLLRLAFEKPADSGEIDTPSAQTLDSPGDQSDRFDELFEQNAGEDEVIDARELKRIINQGIKREQDEEFSKETSRALVKFILGTHRGQAMTREQCRSIWRNVCTLQRAFDRFDEDGSGDLGIKELRRALKAAGYTMSKKALVAVAQKYCGKSSRLSLDDFVLIATKISTTNEAFEEIRRQASGSSGDKLLLSKEQVLQMTL